MDDGTALLAAIAAQPDEDVPRLAYADWCDENGQAERAEFIRVQCDLARMQKPPQGLDRNAPVGMFDERERRFHKWGKNSPWGRQRAALRKRERQLIMLMGRDPIPKIGGPSGIHGYDADARNWSMGGSITGHLVRGFVGRITCEAPDWLAHADAILAAHPVQEVTLMTMPLWIRWQRMDFDTFHIDVQGKSVVVVDKNKSMLTDEDCLRFVWPTVKTWNLPQPANFNPLHLSLPANDAALAAGLRATNAALRRAGELIRNAARRRR